jgi:hypothetical protein
MPHTAARDDARVRTLHELVRVACLFGAAGDTFAPLEKGDAARARKTPTQQLALDSAYARIYFAQADFPRAAMYSQRCLQTSASSDPALRKYQYIPSSVIGRAMAASGKFGPSLPVLTEGQSLDVAGVAAEGHDTKPPARYTEATLIAELEKREIGRPSTYASIMSTLLNRGYVWKKGTALVPAWIGFNIVRLLEAASASMAAQGRPVVVGQMV